MKQDRKSVHFSQTRSFTPIFLNKETNEIQRVVALRNVRNKRYHFKEFIIEGVASIEHAFANHWPIKALFYNREIQLSDWAQTYVKSEQVQKTYAITEELMKVISDREDIPELLAVGEARYTDFSTYKPCKKKRSGGHPGSAEERG